jgi:hypothetical protein
LRFPWESRLFFFFSGTVSISIAPYAINDLRYFL